MSDSQSFPLESLSRPGLWAGSFTPRERYLQDEACDRGPQLFNHTRHTFNPRQRPTARLGFFPVILVPRCR